MYEVSPDYGMMTQAWNIYGFAIPIVQQFFGINPMASNKKVVIKPQMPEEWHSASLENVIVSDNSISVLYSKSNGILTLKVLQENPAWEVEIVIPEMEGNRKNILMESSVEPKIFDNQIVFNSNATTTQLVLKCK
jgi:hypothetical protein